MKRWSQVTQFLQMMELARSQPLGISYDDLMKYFDCSRETAKRMIKELERHAGHHLDYTVGENGTRFWKLDNVHDLRDNMLSVEEFEALTKAVKVLNTVDLHDAARAVDSVKNKIIAQSKRKQALDVDLESYMEAEGIISKPKVKERIDTNQLRIIRESISSFRVLQAAYFNYHDQSTKCYRLEPLGILSGPPHYLVARVRGEENPQNFKLRFLKDLKILPDSYDRGDDFDLETYAQRSFGIFQEEEIYTNIWRVRSDAVNDVLNVQFHPSQKFEPQPDGSLHIIFEACGWKEMCWAIFRWQGKISIIEPDWVKQKYLALLTELNENAR